VGCKPLQWLKPETKGMPPPPRYGHTMNYIEMMNCLVIYGGRNDTLLEKHMNVKDNFMNDIWLLTIENLNWCKVTSIGEVPSSRYFHSAAIYGTRFVIFGGLNASTYNNSDLYICELDPLLSK
jgi:hypothetical protein